MAWWSGFAILDQWKLQNLSSPAPKPYIPPQAQQQAGYDPMRAMSRTINWESVPAATRPKATPAAFPEKINFATPFSSAPPLTKAPVPDQPRDPNDPFGFLRDFAAPFNAAIGHTNFDLGNVIPHAQELTSNLLHGLGDAAEGANLPVFSPVVGTVLHAQGNFVDAVLNVNRFVAHTVDPVINAIPNWYRDSQLGDRAKVYAAIAKGQQVNPDFLMSGDLFGLLGLLIPFSQLKGQMAAANLTQDPNVNPYAGIGDSARDLADRYNNLRNALLHPADGKQQLDASTQIEMLKAAIDLPESVKQALDANPLEDAQKLLDTAPEGRRFTYTQGPEGMAREFGTPMIFWLAEAKAFGGALGAAPALAEGGFAARTAAAGLKVTKLAATGFMRINTAALAAGAGAGTVATAMDTIARFQGNEAAIRWGDSLLRTTPYSDDPKVQLVTAFAVNPVAGLKLLKQGTLPLGHGVGDVTIGKALGDKFARYYTNADRMKADLAGMYGVSRPEIEDIVARHYEGNMGLVFDEVAGNAADWVLNTKLSNEERLAIVSRYGSDRPKQTAAVFQLHGAEIEDALRNHQAELVDRWRNENWAYAQFPGAFHSEVAAYIADANRLFNGKTYEIQSQMDAVAGYRELIPPEGIATLRSRLAEITAADGTVAVRSAEKGAAGLNSVQGLIADNPALRKLWQGLITTEERVPAATVSKMIDRAEAAYATKARTNPVYVATGADPVLRPDSAFPERDMADALGTHEPTIKAISDFRIEKPDAAGVNLMRDFLVDRVGLSREEALALPPEKVWEQASQYVHDTTKPWVEAGRAAVHDAKERIALTRRLTELNRALGPADRRERDAAGRPVEYDPQLLREREMAQRDLAGLGDLAQTARDPIMTYAERAQHVRSAERAVTHEEKMAEAAKRKVIAQQTLTELADLDAEMAELVKGSPVPWYELLKYDRDNGWLWGGGADAVPWSIRLKLAKFLHKGEAAGGSVVTDARAAGYARDAVVDEGFPGLIRQLRRQLAHEDFRKTLTPKELDKAESLRPGSFLEDFRTSGTASTTADIAAQADLMGQLIRGAEHRASILADAADGSLYKLRQTAKLDVPEKYVAYARDDLAGLNFDAEFMAREHPHNIEAVRIATEAAMADGEHGFLDLEPLIENDQIIVGKLGARAEELNLSLKEYVSDPANAGDIHAQIVPQGWEAPTPGVLRPMTPLDDQILAGQITDLAEKLQAARDEPMAPIQNVTEAEWRSLTAKRDGVPAVLNRISTTYRRRLMGIGADLYGHPNEALLANPENKIGLQVLSLLNRGVLDTEPATLNGVIALMRDIETGHATGMGIGADLQAEGMRVGRDILGRAVVDAKAAGFDKGVLTTGRYAGVIPDDLMALALDLMGKDAFDWNAMEPFENMRYGLKARPSDAVVMAKVPGLAEEFISKHFAPWEERVGIAWARQAFNYVFGGLGNRELGMQIRTRFVERLAALGVDGQVADAVWSAWKDTAANSHVPKVRVDPVTRARQYISGDNRYYGDVRNIPNDAMGKIAQDAVHEHLAGLESVDPAYRAHLETIAFDEPFREASSFIRSHLVDTKTPLGENLAAMYGKVAHNQWVTTKYYQYRFGMDMRFHAQNFVEQYVLGYGRAGFKPAREVHFGQTEAAIRKLDQEAVTNAGYMVMNDRGAQMYGVFEKLQEPALLDRLKGLQTERPELMEKALKQIAEQDPELSKTIAVMGDTPETYLKVMDAYWEKLLRTSTDEEVAAVIDGEMSAALRESPELNEVYGELRQANVQVIHDLRDMFYGRSERSRIERVLNNPLLFWPISYQYKAAKWLMRILFDSVGGLPTNAGGAYMLDQAMAVHNRALVEDPGYARWFEEHPTLVFIAQMLMPITWDSMGTSLTPGLRSMFFGRTKAIWDIGPIFTYAGLVPKAMDELYPDLSAIPEFDRVFRGLAGHEPGARTITIQPKAPVEYYSNPRG